VVTLKGPGEACNATSQCQTSLVCRSGKCAVLDAALSCTSPGGAPTVVADSVVHDPFGHDPGSCVSTIQLPAFGGASDIFVQDLGVHGVGDLVSFTVTTGASSFSIVSQEVGGSTVDEFFVPDFGATIPNAVVPDQVKTPAGALYYDDVHMSTSADAFYLGFSAVSGTFTAPNTSAGLETVRNGNLPAGAWSLVTNDWANECGVALNCSAPKTGRYHLQAVSKAAPVVATGALDVEVYLLLDPANTVTTTAAQAAADASYRRWATSLAFYLGRAGLCVGNVTFHDLPTWVHDRYPSGHVDIDGDGPCAPLPQLFTAAAVPSRGVHIFLVDDLTVGGTPQGGTTTIVGVDGSIPGPSGFPGTINSGAVVGLLSTIGTGTCPATGNPTFSCGADLIAYVAAHEIGHWLGLSHTTEMTGLYFDVLTDTPQCPCSLCATSSQRASCKTGTVQVTAAQCRTSTCGGGDNLMFWLLQPGVSAGALSRDQGQVMRLNPAVR
jgi:hypothetical protein